MKLFTTTDPNILTGLVDLGVEAEEARRVARRARMTRLAAGTRITEIGSPRRELVLLLSGRAVARRADGTQTVLTAGSVIGEVSVLGIRLFQVADVEVLEDAVAVRIDGADYLELEPHAPSLARIVRAAAARRLSSLEQARRDDRTRRYAQAREIQDALRSRGLGLPMFVD